MFHKAVKPKVSQNYSRWYKNYQKDVDMWKNKNRLQKTFHTRPQNNMLGSPLAFKHTPKERNKIFLGIEYETYWGGENLNATSIYSNETLRHYCSPGYDCADTEIRFIPATLKYHKQILSQRFFKTDTWKKIVNDPRNQRQNRAGIHIHIDGQAFNKRSLTKFLMFFTYEKNREFLEHIADRPLDSYSKPMNPRYTGCYTYKGEILAPNFKLLNNYNENGLQGSGFDCIDKTRIVNLYSLRQFNTIEIRMFRTTSDRVRFLSNLEFCDAMTRYCRIAAYKNLTVPMFLKYIRGRRHLYPNLIKIAKGW